MKIPLILMLAMAAGLALFGCAGGEPVGETPGNDTGTNASNQSGGPAAPPENPCVGPVCGSDGQTYATDCDAVAGGAQAVSMGGCPEPGLPECQDSDGGVDGETAGTVTMGAESRSDFCNEDALLVEYSCQDGAMHAAAIQCGDGKACDAGRCVQAQGGNASHGGDGNETAPKGCFGPSETDIHARQAVTYNGMEYGDTCTDYRGVKEYYCQMGALQSINTQCPPGYGCMNGQCDWLQPSCSDSDGGNDTETHGTVTVLKGYLTVNEYSDRCIDEGKIKEYYCFENGTASWSEELCPSGTKCFEDRCVKGECSDSDGGINIYRRGIAEDAEGEYEDECVNDYEVREHYCYGDSVVSDTIDCGDGYICNGDSARCLEGSVD